MPSGSPLEWEVSFLLIQADVASQRGLIQALGHMDSSDQLTLQDLADTRQIVARMRSRSLLAAAVGGILFTVLIAVLWLWRHPAEGGVAALLAGISWLVFGLPLFVHWLRHWRRIQLRLRTVEEQVKSGQVVYGSQVQF